LISRAVPSYFNQSNIQAFEWYTKSAEIGNCYAQNSVACFYEEGIVVEKNPEMAVYWYNKAAEGGYAWAQCNLAYCLQSGIGVEKNEALGAYWYREAATQGHSRYVGLLKYVRIPQSHLET
jgi:TPR repeat protein